VERVGVKDDFFILGGHSIKAMKLLARIHKDFDVKVKLEDVFRTPTLEEISKDIYRKIWIKKGAETKNAELISDDSFII
jgi:acyl carrier protein